MFSPSDDSLPYDSALGTLLADNIKALSLESHSILTLMLLGSTWKIDAFLPEHWEPC